MGRHWNHGSGSSQSQRDNDDVNDLQSIHVFGYEARLFDDPTMACALERHGERLVPWLDGQPLSNEPLWLDRYDVCHILDDPALLHKPSTADLVFRLDTAYDPWRYEALNHLRAPLVKCLAEPLLLKQNQQFNQPSPPRTLNWHGDIPHDMLRPDSQRQVDIVYKTAKCVADTMQQAQRTDPSARQSQTHPLEGVIQGKQSHNPLFEFLHRTNALHPYYLHLRWLCQAGLAWSDEDDSSDTENEAPACSISQRTPMTPLSTTDAQSLARTTGVSQVAISDQLDSPTLGLPLSPARQQERQAKARLLAERLRARRAARQGSE
ncbi:hypothetical protein H4R34_004949 [Dimargaris verticillata]|uniref:Suppressor of white apricot N-terminal domain-containing protein n=1 Tax=Dimargaris verticillata TaxID=2761393 RepID=A0A9W8E6P1_9FUNG|nr:hypothetical protein H4R34_004949 [Dimargaris verticillata]